MTSAKPISRPSGDKNLPLRCACGNVRAVASNIRPSTVNHIICGCSSCKAYAQHLGVASATLDEYGGTRVFQMSPRNLEITGGRDSIACLRITPEGPLRWYAECCKAPLAITFATPGIPFVGINCAFIDMTFVDGALTDILGPVAVRVNTRGEAPDKGALRLLATIVRFSGMILKWRFNGDYKRSPFFDGGAPIATPQFTPVAIPTR